jgi:FG-GAP-like repeat/Regulator of chromosome condensation (RCC1) repeat
MAVECLVSCFQFKAARQAEQPAGAWVLLRKMTRATLAFVGVALALASNSSLAQVQQFPLLGVTKFTANGPCVILAGGSLRCLGYDSYTAREVSKSLPGGVTAIAGTCVVTTAGGVKCWNTSFGPPYVATDVAGLGSGVTAIAAGLVHTCALMASGGVKCWGENSFGQLGDNTVSPRTAPVDVAGLTSGVIAIAAGYSHTCALTSGGGVKCWGFGDDGEVGDNAGRTRIVPVDVSGLASGVAALSAGGSHTCALTNTGGVKCWGRNLDGQLGDVSRTSRWAPVNVANLASGVASISAGGDNTCAVTTGGAVKCWGNNDSGQLGDGFTFGSPAPLDVVGLTSGVSAVSSAGSRTCSLAINGDFKCWGNGYALNAAVVLAPKLVTSVATDFNDDLKSDSLQQDTDGSIYMYINGGRPPVLLVGPGTGYSFKQIADFNGDGKADIVLENINGSTEILLMNGPTITSRAFLSGPGGPWKVSQVGDFNGDGKADVILRHTDGSLYLALMNGTTVASGAYLTSGNAWAAAGVADLNGDGKSDVILKNADGSLYILIMNGTSITSGAYLTLGNAWALQQTGDFNGDGKADVLLKNADGSTAIVLLNGTAVLSAAYLTNPGSQWNGVAVGDFNFDGKADIVLNNADGTNVILLMNGAAVVAANYLTSPGVVSYKVTSTGDFDGDGQTDLILQNLNPASVYYGYRYLVYIDAGLVQRAPVDISQGFYR